MHNTTIITWYLMFTSLRACHLLLRLLISLSNKLGMASIIILFSFLFSKDLVWHLLSCFLESIQLWKSTNTWSLEHGIYIRFFMLINPRTYDGVLSLLYYAQNSAIQIDINNKSILHACDDQTHTCKEFNKTESNQIKHQHMNCSKVN
jgi:hypothetical protein